MKPASRHRAPPSPAIRYTISRAAFMLSMFLTGGIITVYLLDAGLSFTQVGLVWTIELLLMALGALPAGPIADRWGRRATATAGALLFAVSRALMAWAPSLSAFYLAAACSGLGSTAYTVALNSWLVDEQIRLDAADRTSSVITFSQGLGSTLGLIAGLSIGAWFHGPLSRLYLISGAVGALVVLLTAGMPENRGSREHSLRLLRRAAGGFLRSRPLLWITAQMVLIWLAFTAYLFAWQPLGVAAGIPRPHLASLHAVYLGLSALTCFLAGRPVARRGERAALAALLPVMLAGLCLLALPGRPAVIGGVALFAAGYGPLTPLLIGWSHRFIPPPVRASLSALINLVSLGGIAAFQLGCGLIVDHWGLHVCLFTGAAFLLLAFLLVLLTPAREGDEKRGPERPGPARRIAGPVPEGAADPAAGSTIGGKP